MKARGWLRCRVLSRQSLEILRPLVMKRKEKNEGGKEGKERKKERKVGSWRRELGQAV
jgi:hypothetical protein